MSLFQAREWWGVGSDAEDNYDSGGLLVAPLADGGESETSDKIITGSLNGIIRIWAPSSPVGAAGSSATAQDLLLEERLSAPILQLAVGRFSSLHSGLSLAVLHPHKLVVFTLIRGDGDGAVGTSGPALFHRLQRLYEHVFAATGAHFTAANMCFGPFGGAAASGSGPRRDSIAIQSMDGQLAIYEQERFQFRRNLNSMVPATGADATGAGGSGASGGSGSAALSFLLPGPLLYCPRTDSIIVSSSDMLLHSFTYGAIAGATGSDPSAAPSAAAAAGSAASVSAASSAGRRLRPDWSVNVGEYASHACLGALLPLSLTSGTAGRGAVAASASPLGATAGVGGRAGAAGGAGGGDASAGSSGSGGAPYSVDIVVAGDRGLFVLRDSGPRVGGGAGGASNASVQSAADPSVGGAGGTSGRHGHGHHLLDVIASAAASNKERSAGDSRGTTATSTADAAALLPGPVGTSASGSASTAPVPGQGQGYGGIAAAAAGANGLRSHRKLDFPVAAMACFSRSGGSAPSTLQSLLPREYGLAGSGLVAGAEESLAQSSAQSHPHGLLLLSHGGVLHVYREEKLVWAARLPPAFTAAASSSATAVAGGAAGAPGASVSLLKPVAPVPVAVAVGRFAGVAGLIVALSSAGHLTVAYCGTEPPLGGAITGGEAVRDLDYRAVEKEHKALQARIKELHAAAAAAERAGAGGAGGSGAAPDGPLLIDVHVPSKLTPPLRQAGAAGGAGGSAGGGGGTSGFALSAASLGVPDSGTTSSGAASPAEASLAAAVERELEDLRYAEWEGADDNVAPAGGALTSPSAAGSRPSSAAGSRTGTGTASASASASASGAVSDPATFPICMVSVRLRLNDAFVASTGSKSRGSAPSPFTARGVHITVSSPAWALLPRGRRHIYIPLITRDGHVGLAGGDGSAGTGAASGSASGSGSGASSAAVSEPSAPVGLGAGSGVEEYESELRPGGRAFRILLPFRCSPRGMPSDDMSVTLAAAFTFVAEISKGKDKDKGADRGALGAGAGETRAASASFALPLVLAVPPVPPLKTATFKLTVEANRSPPPSLLDVFSDCLTQPPGVLPVDSLPRIVATGAFALSFGYRCGADATILVSKTGGRFRVQAGSLEALTLVTCQLCDRLTAYYAASEAESGSGLSSAGEAPFAISFSEPLPLGDIMAAVEAHLAARRKLLAAYAELNDRCHEYRLVAKRLLVRWKDTSPAPLNGLDTLLELAQEAVQGAGHKVSEGQAALAAAANRLSCCIALMHRLLRLKFALNSRSAELISRALPSSVVDSLDRGWEEEADAGLVYLLRGLSTGSGTSAGTADIKGSVAGGAGGMASAEAAAAIAAAANASIAGAGAGGGSGGGSGASLSMPADITRLRARLAALLDCLSRAGPRAGSLVSDALPLPTAPPATATTAATGGAGAGAGAGPASKNRKSKASSSSS